MNTQTHNPELVNYAIDGINNILDNFAPVYGCDLHHELFNTEYFIIGYYNAEKWLTENVGIFKAIDQIQNYEKMNFGQINTDLANSERVANMYAYIKGEEILSNCEHLQSCWDNYLTENDLLIIKEELEAML
jgi:hypothetical protein